MTHAYREISQLKFIYLEESFVLGIVARPGALLMDMDFVLTPEHSDYSEPSRSEAFCFRRGRISFEAVEVLHWDGQGALPAIDSTGEKDYGHVDSFTWEGDQYELSGDWGHIGLHAASPLVRLTH